MQKIINPPSRDLAVKFALENKWEQALKENKRLLEEDQDNVDTLNRLAYSLSKLGKFRKAKEYYNKVLKNDKTNPIALKNLKRLETISKKYAKDFEIIAPTAGMNLSDVFIEEAGKTKTIDLKNVTDKKTISILQPGDSVILVVKRSKVFVQMPSKTYIGMLPDSIGMRMIPLLNGGNEYAAFIKALGENSVTVFIKEIRRMARFKNQPSFTHIPRVLSIAKE